MESLDVGSFVMGLMLGVVDAVAVMLLLRSLKLEKRLKCATSQQASQAEAVPNWKTHKAPVGPPPVPAKRVEVTHINAPPRPVKDKLSDAPPRPGSGG